MALRAPGTESAGGHYTVDSSPSYGAEIYAFHHDIPDPVRANADSVLAPDRESTELVTLKALIKREKLWVTKYFTTVIYTNPNAAGKAVTVAINGAPKAMLGATVAAGAAVASVCTVVEPDESLAAEAPVTLPTTPKNTCNSVKVSLKVLG